MTELGGSTWGEPVPSRPAAGSAAGGTGLAVGDVAAGSDPLPRPDRPARERPARSQSGPPSRRLQGRPDPLPPLTRSDRRKIRIVEQVGGHRIHSRVGLWRRVRSAVVLFVLALVLAAVLAAILASIVAALALAFHHVSGN